ncbi:hypothetical protein ACMYR3_00545 [Ampullimonas aquatilis]|uniref:hypothetical protein n=1 Tax=Ampullimonas aquatilis TaxID=1341549 RepID=UPI003C77E735
MASYRTGKSWSPHLAGDFLQKAEGLAGLMPAARRAMTMEARLQKILPPGLAEQVMISVKNPQQPVLFVPSSAVATKVRQLLPSLNARLAQQGIVCEKLTVKVSRNQHVVAAPVKQAVLSQRGLDELQQLHASLPEGALKASIAVMIARHSQ